MQHVMAEEEEAEVREQLGGIGLALGNAYMLLQPVDEAPPGSLLYMLSPD
jgi:hypothetical protein